MPFDPKSSLEKATGKRTIYRWISSGTHTIMASWYTADWF